MNSNDNNLCEDWGWFIDIESNNSNIIIPSRKIFVKSNIHFNKLHTIEEDEYDYYEKYYKNLEEQYDTNEIEPTKPSNRILNVGSTTLITALLTYVIFCIF